MGDKGDKGAARPPDGSLVETRCLKGPKSAIVPFAEQRSVYLSLPPTRHDEVQNRLRGVRKERAVALLN